jgi:DNA-binding response OmpR family regulator
MIEASVPRDFHIKSFAAYAEALLIVGEVAPGFVATLNPDLPLFNVGRYQLADAFHFIDYKDPRLFEMLWAFSPQEPFFSYNDVLFCKLGRVLFLGYELKLTAAQRSVLRYLVLNSDRQVSCEELLEICLGDAHKKRTSVSKLVSAINAKAYDIGGRRMICSPERGFYRIEKYI